MASAAMKVTQSAWPAGDWYVWELMQCALITLRASTRDLNTNNASSRVHFIQPLQASASADVQTQKTAVLCYTRKTLRALSNVRLDFMLTVKSVCLRIVPRIIHL